MAETLTTNNDSSLDQVLDAMLGVLEKYLPPPSVPPPPPGPPPPELPLPAASFSLVSVAERSVGLGNRVGNDTRGPFGVLALKGTRIEAVVRFQLWASLPSDVDGAIRDLTRRLLGDRDALRALGFLRLALTSTSPNENVQASNAWRAGAEFSVLYEFPYVDSDGAESLIARIPVNINSEFGESTSVTDEMTRWDNQSAPALVLRGGLNIDRLSALVFIPGAAPSGTVTLTRTFDGATGPPPTHLDLPTFLAAITDPDHPAREGRVTFASLSAFLAAFSAAGDPVTLGDWNLDSVPDTYQSLALAIEPPIKLPSVADRLEVTYQNSAFDQVTVVYLRAAHGLTT